MPGLSGDGMASLSELRARLQENWQEGKFDATADEEEIRLDGCDKPLRPEDKEEELDVLARQLSSQMEYNNLLLEHLQALEESHLEAQREVKKKEHALKLALSVGHAAKSDAAEMRRKWAMASELAETMTRRCEEASIEIMRKQQDIDAQRRQVEGAQEVYERLLTQKSMVEDRLARAESDLENVRGEFNRTRTQDGSRIEQLTALTDDTAKELQDLRKVHIPLSMEHKKIVQANMQLERDVDQANARLLAESRAREAAEQRIREVEVAGVRMREAQKQLKSSLQEAQARVTQLEAELMAINNAKKAAEEDLQAREAWLTELKQEHKRAVEENKALKSELEQVANELLCQARLRAHEQERWAKKLANSQEQLANATEDARLQAQKYAIESQKRCAEHLTAVKASEEQYIALQAEHAELHDLLKEVHSEHKQRLESFEEERHGYEEDLRQVKEKLAATEMMLGSREQELLQLVDRLKEELRKTRAEMNTRGSRYVQMLSTLQEHVSSLTAEGAACREEVSEIAADFQTFQKCVKTFAAGQVPPLEAWYGEVQGGMEAVIEQNKDLQRELEDRGDQVKEKEVKVEELRADLLRHQAELSSLRHEVVDAEARLTKHQRATEEKLSAAAEENEAVRREKDEVERRLRRIQETLDFANSQNKKLQEQSQALAKQVAEQQASHAATSKRLEDSISGLDKERKVLDKTRMELLQEREELLRALQEEEKEKHLLHDRIKELEAVVERQEVEKRAMEARAQRKFHETQHVLQQSAKQVEHTQRLLHVMRQGKAEAEEQKWAVQSEMQDLQAEQLLRDGGVDPRAA